MAELSEDELKLIASAFKEMKVKPKADTPEDFKQWMANYVAQMSDEGNVNVKTEQNATKDQSSASTKITSHYIPKISCFSGDGSKQDTTYDLWRYEVDCLLKEKYSEEIVAQSMRRSLRGDAGKVAMRLGPEANVSQILDKMESVFGTIERGETIMEQFYSARQEKGEDSMSWSCRLEEIYRKAVIKGVAKREETNEKLRSKYWNGLHQWIRDITGYKFDALTDFDNLRKEIRLVEKEHDTKKAQTHMAVANESEKSDDMKELKGMIQQLTTKVNALEQGDRKSQQNNNSSSKYTGPKDRQQQRGRGNYRSQGYGRGYQERSHPQYDYYDGYAYGYEDMEAYETEDGEPICFRCKQPGHLALGCRVRMDHSKRALNYRRPSLRGKR